MKPQKHLPIFGVGPIYVFIISVLTFAAYRMRNLSALSSGRIDVLQKPLFVLGVILIVLGVFIWFQAAVVSRLLDGIVKNRLITTGIYAWVRNPLYTAFMIACTGVILMAGNLWFFCLPFVFWGFMTVLMKHTEEQWLRDLYGKQYDEYCSRVNRCWPWFPRRKYGQKHTMKQYEITVHEFGKQNPDVVVMFHPLGVWWDVFDRVIPILERRFHLVIPAVPGLDPDQPEQAFTSIEEIEEQIETWLIGHGHQHVACLYGCSMGGALAIRMLAQGVIVPKCAVIDAGITPYRMPKAFTCLIGARDWCAVEFAKHVGVRMLNAFTDTSKFTRDDLLYVKKVLSGMSSKTIWRAFYSTNNYSMPESVSRPPCPVQYWYGEAERSARKRDIAYMKKVFPDTVFVENKGQAHAEFFTLRPEAFCDQLETFIRVSG